MNNKMSPSCFLCNYNQVAESGRMCLECIKLIEDMIKNERIWR